MAEVLQVELPGVLGQIDGVYILKEEKKVIKIIQTNTLACLKKHLGAQNKSESMKKEEKHRRGSQIKEKGDGIHILLRLYF